MIKLKQKGEYLMLYNEMSKESKYLEQSIQALEAKLQSFPKENF